MPAPINVELRGYLDFFGLKNGGMNPQVPAAVLGPTMDLTRWYLESRMVDYQWSSAVAANFLGPIPITSTTPQNLSNGTGVFVPQSEIWLLLPGTTIFWTMVGNSGAAGVDLTYMTRGPSNQVTPLVPMGELQGFTDSNAALVRAGSRTLEQVVWLEPGMELVAYAYGAIVAGPGNVTRAGWLRIVRLRI